MKSKDIKLVNEDKSMLLIGNFLSKHGGTRGISEELRDQLLLRGWTINATSSIKHKMGRLIKMMWDILAWNHKYDIAHIDVFSGNAFLWAEMATFLLRFLHKPYILTLHGGGLPKFYEIHPGRVKRLLLSAIFVTTPSRYLQLTFLSIRKDIQFLSNAIEIADYSYRNRTNVKPLLMWLRAFNSIYNPALAIDVLAEVKSEYPRSSLTMVGPDKHDGTLENVKDRATFYEVVNVLKIDGAINKKDVPAKLNEGDIFLNTTNIESFGVSVLEAAACGLCIVTTNVGELSFMWEDEIDALLVPPNDPHAMAQAVKRILTEEGLAARLSANARKKAEQFDWSVILPQWEELLGKVIEQVNE